MAKMADQGWQKWRISAEGGLRAKMADECGRWIDDELKIGEMNRMAGRLGRCIR